ncbi:MAG: hypothetical protein J5630_01820 [Bacteroidaceae bacterium]|nr:hypothetical protein [Bacteroidaceae bacterium]
MACCNAIMAQDADIIENLLFTPGNSCLVSFPAGTRLTLYDYPRVGVDLGSTGIDISDVKTIGVVFSEDLVSDMISFCYMTQPDGTDGQVSTWPKFTPGSNEYTYTLKAAEKTEGTKIYKFGIYYRNKTNSADPTVANLAIEKLYIIDNNDVRTDYNAFKTFSTYGVIVHQQSAEVTFNSRYAEFNIVDEEGRPLSYKTTDGETNTYKFIFAEDLYDKIHFRLRTGGGKDVPAFTIHPSTADVTVNDNTLKLQYDSEKDEYWVEKEVTTADLTKGNAVRVYVSCTGEKNLVDPSAEKDTPNYNKYTAPWSCTIKSITRRGREGVTINNIINDEGWTTYCNTKRLEYSRKDDMDAYIVTARNASNGALTLQKVSIVPGNSDGEGVTTPVILKIPKMNGVSSVTFGIPSTTLAADDVSANMLHASTGDGFTVTADGNTYYALANKKYGVGFYKVRTGVTIPKGRAYLIVNNNQELSAREFWSFDESGSESTDITSIVTEMPTEGESAVYDLMGRSVQKTQRGHLYIRNGRKFIAK